MWAGLNAAQRISVVLAAVLAVAGTAGVVVLLRPEFVPLYSRMGPEEAAQVVAKLESLGVSHRITGGGTTVQVPKDRVYAVRLQLAAEGLPRGGTGFELFDKTSFGASDLTQRVNYQRALQGELVRTIGTLAEVESARVHLALPQERLFTDASPSPSASVVLRLRPGAALTRQQVRAITHLVASSVEGMSPDRVTVVDAQGTLFSSGQQEAAGMGAAQMAEREQIEAAIEHRLQTMLDRVLGSGRSIVRVSAQVDFSRRQIQEESFSQNSRAPKSEITVEESYDGRGASSGAASGSAQGASTASGSSGQAGAVPSYAASASRGGVGSQYLRRESRTTYEVARRVEREISAGGAIRRLSVAVLVDQAVPAAQVAALKEAIAAGVGFDASRRDSIVVQTVPFPPPPAAPPTGATQDQPAPSASRLLPVAIGVGLLMVLAAIVLAAAVARGRRPRVQTLQPSVLPQGAATPAAAPPEDEEERILAALRRQQKEQPETLVVRREAQRLVQERPADAAAILKTWISER